MESKSHVMVTQPVTFRRVAVLTIEPAKSPRYGFGTMVESLVGPPGGALAYVVELRTI